jgi:tetratricopeptide (TPR) repeat protein
VARAVVLLVLLLAPLAAAAGERLQVGDRVRPRQLPALQGGSVPLPGGARVLVVAFVRTGQEHSRHGLGQLRELEAELGPRGVRLVAVASAGDDRAALQDLAQVAGPAIPLLLDPGDALYGELGVKQHPAFAVIGADGRLAAWQPFQTINNRELLRANIRLALGEASRDDVEAARSPAAARDVTSHAAVRVKLGRRLLERGNAAGASTQAREAILLDPAYAPGHALLGSALAAQGRCSDAERALARALQLQPGEPSALAARGTCRER